MRLEGEGRIINATSEVAANAAKTQILLKRKTLTIYLVLLANHRLFVR